MLVKLGKVPGRHLAGGEAGLSKGSCQGCLLFDSSSYFWAGECAAEALGSLPHQLAMMLSCEQNQDDTSTAWWDALGPPKLAASVSSPAC